MCIAGGDGLADGCCSDRVVAFRRGGLTGEMERQPERPPGDSSSSPGVEGAAQTLRYLGKGTPSEDGRVVLRESSSRSEEFYRDRWRHDKRGALHPRRQLHRLVLVDGLRARRHHLLGDAGDGLPRDDARTCPTRSRAAVRVARPSPGTPIRPARVRYPYVRGMLLEMWREARRIHDDPVDAWAEHRADPAKAQLYKNARGHGGFVRASLG